MSIKALSHFPLNQRFRPLSIVKIGCHLPKATQALTNQNYPRLAPEINAHKRYTPSVQDEKSPLQSQPILYVLSSSLT